MSENREEMHAKMRAKIRQKRMQRTGQSVNYNHHTRHKSDFPINCRIQEKQKGFRQQKEFGELASRGFVTKTPEQADRESRGTHHGIVCSVGSEAYKAKGLGDKLWLKEGEVAIFDRYAGVEMELPPGSGEMYRFTNDESILGAMVERGKKS